MPRKALVTGGAGFIGSHLCNQLLENRYDVISYDDLSNGSGKKNLDKQILRVKGSILNHKKFRNICKKVDVVFNLAVKPLPMSFDKPDEVVQVNDYGTYLIAKICTELKCKLIHISSSEAYGSARIIPMKENHPLLPSTIYAASKASSEMYVRGFYETNRLQMVIVRPFNCYGPFMREDLYAAAIPKFYNRILTGKHPIIDGNGNQTRDLTYVKDTTLGIMLADKEQNAIGKTFNIGQGKEISIKKLGKIMIKQFEEYDGIKREVRFDYRKPRKGDVKRHLADISSAKKILGYKPKIKLEEGLSEYLKWKMS